MTSYRSDRAGRLSYFIHHYPTRCAAIVLSIWGPLVWTVLNLMGN